MGQDASPAANLSKRSILVAFRIHPPFPRQKRGRNGAILFHSLLAAIDSSTGLPRAVTSQPSTYIGKPGEHFSRVGGGIVKVFLLRSAGFVLLDREGGYWDQGKA
jgi:hypothetical protein